MRLLRCIWTMPQNKRDAKWIADIFKHDLVAGSFIPPADIRQLRDLARYRWKLTNFTTGEKNRAQNCLTVSNFKLDDVFSNVFGKAASAITARILEKTERCAKNRLKSSASSVPIWTALHCVGSIWNP